MLPKIIISPGEPAGIGPDIALIASQTRFNAELIITGDIDCLAARAQILGLNIAFSEWNPNATASQTRPSQVNVINIPLNKKCTPGEPDPANASQVLDCLKIANKFCIEKNTNALVTGPISKTILSKAHPEFSGHTEFLAELSNSPQPVMLFITPNSKVALLTTHLPLTKVPAAINKDKLKSVIRVLYAALQNIFKIKNPHIKVCGLNPHAGENGLLGSEEQEIISPTLAELRQEGIKLTGPVAADTAFVQNQLINSDAILAMYHDQALPAVKTLDFGQTVNTTLGLPYIRTSVDHGVAYDVAGTKKANAESLIAAIDQAITLTY